MIQADAQSNGHGRHGRNWISPPGNLYCSLLLRPGCEVRLMGQISLLTGLALIDTAQNLVDDPARLQLKWPNDLLLDGLKCAGIILETGLDLSSGRVDWLAIGVGLNLTSAPPGIGASLQSDQPVQSVLAQFLDCFDRRYQSWKIQGFEGLRRDWLGLAHPRGAALTVKIGENQQSGTFNDLDEFGNLILSCGQNTLKTITAGDVYMNNGAA